MEKLDALFHEALELQGEARAVHLAKVCGDDEQLRAEAERLIAAHEQEGSFLDSPILAEPAEPSVDDRRESMFGRSMGHYKIVSPLGRGGMGEVYLAEDSRLERKVALKVLPATFTQHADRVRRFEREAKAASALNHPNILTIHEIGESDGVNYIISEFVEGETLRALIKQGKLDIIQALAITEQVASALGVAHQAGIIHRDIKPENVMVRPDGLVKVLDFGLAKLTEQSASTVELDSKAEVPAQLSTESGMMMGTVSYMSPEQARGQKVDHRTDIFSFGVMFYEMIAGRRPFEGTTASDVIAALLTARPKPLKHHCAEATSEIERVINICLAKDREERYASARELIADLKRLQTVNQTKPMDASRMRIRFESWRLPVVSAIIAVVFLGLILFLIWKSEPAVQPGQVKSLAVLPLENLSGDPTQEYFADGMTEALISNLTQVHALRVISRTSVMRFKGSRKPLAEIARELNVDALIEGSVRRDGGRVKITARLIQAVNETLIRSFDYERELADVLKLQSEIARAVTNEIRTQVTTEEQARLASARSVNPESHEAYLLGRYHLRRQNETDLKLAINHFERAIRIDAGYAAAWAGLSVAWQQRGLWGATPFREVEMPARRAAIKALELDTECAEGYTSLAILKNRYDWDWSGSEHDFRRAIELDPGSVEAHRYFAFLLSALGRHNEAISEIQIAEQRDPLSSIMQSDFGGNLYHARKYEQAEQRENRAIELDPQNTGAYRRLVSIYFQMGKYSDALACLEKITALENSYNRDRINNRDSIYATDLALTYALMGRREESLRILKRLLRTTNPSPIHERQLAYVWAALGNKDEAFRLLSNEIDKRVNLLIFLKIDPLFDSLHSDPRWKNLLRRMNFPE